LRDFLAASTCTKTIFNGVPRIDPNAARAVRKAKRNELGLTDEDFLVLAVGRLVEQKRPFHYLRIARELYTKGIGWPDGQPGTALRPGPCRAGTRKADNAPVMLWGGSRFT
jgi:hypothetical protein